MPQCSIYLSLVRFWVSVIDVEIILVYYFVLTTTQPSAAKSDDSTCQSHALLTQYVLIAIDSLTKYSQLCIRIVCQMCEAIMYTRSGHIKIRVIIALYPCANIMIIKPSR